MMCTIALPTTAASANLRWRRIGRAWRFRSQRRWAVSRIDGMRLTRDCAFPTLGRERRLRRCVKWHSESPSRLRRFASAAGRAKWVRRGRLWRGRSAGFAQIFGRFFDGEIGDQSTVDSGVASDFAELGKTHAQDRIEIGNTTRPTDCECSRIQRRVSARVQGWCRA